MLINFTDSYNDAIFNGLEKVGEIQSYLCEQEKFLGHSRYLDKLHAQSILLSGIIDQLMYDDNSNPEANEGLLLCLKNLCAQEICPSKRAKIKRVNNYHETSPVNEIIEGRESEEN